MGFWAWFKRVFHHPEKLSLRENSGPDRRMISLVLLQREVRPLDADALSEKAQRAWGSAFHSEPDRGGDFVTGDHSTFMLRHGHQVFMVNALESPYLNDPDAAAEPIVELRLRKAVRTHQGWYSVDLMGNVPEQEEPDAFRKIGRLLAELADDDTLAIYCPATNQIAAFDPEMSVCLRSANPLDVFDLPVHPPVVPVTSHEPRLEAAVEKARRQWPRFVAAFEERTSDQSFFVKARIGDGDNFEFMWLTVTGLENGYIYGKLDNDPVDIPSLHCGDRIRVKDRDLNDWLFTDREQRHGGFTIEVLRQINDELQG